MVGHAQLGAHEGQVHAEEVEGVLGEAWGEAWGEHQGDLGDPLVGPQAQPTVASRDGVGWVLGGGHGWNKCHSSHLGHEPTSAAGQDRRPCLTSGGCMQMCVDFSPVRFGSAGYHATGRLVEAGQLLDQVHSWKPS